MTRPARQRKLPPKSPPKRKQLVLPNWALMAAIGLAVWAGVQTPKASPTDRLVVNAETGLAISGFDPVAYFTVSEAVLGSPYIELTQNGAVWRFLNEGNRAAFALHPEVYTPQFGGYDPVAIDREASVPGHPQIWAVSGERLYLFYSEKARADFLENPSRFVESAARKWADVSRTIAR